jgi:hypothetical protein
MTAAYAAEIVTWRYPPPYDLYDTSDADAATLTSADGGFFALVDRDELIGFRSFGADGQVPGGSYDSAALDTGGGLRPDLTGKGLGRTAVQAGLAFWPGSVRPGRLPGHRGHLQYPCAAAGAGAWLRSCRQLPGHDGRPELRDTDPSREHSATRRIARRLPCQCPHRIRPTSGRLRRGRRPGIAGPRPCLAYGAATGPVRTPRLRFLLRPRPLVAALPVQRLHRVRCG